MRDITLRWMAGWLVSRGFAEPEPVGGDGRRVATNTPERDAEIFALADDPATVERLVARLRTEPGVTWLTVPTRDPDRTAAVLAGAGLEFVSRTEALMTTDLSTQPARKPPAGYAVEVAADGPVLHVSVRDDTGVEAAHGYAGLVGADAIVDRILTFEAHRRRGLGGVVMSMLGEAALARGATNGVLFASREGQALYRSLGWAHVADVLVSRRPA